MAEKPTNEKLWTMVVFQAKTKYHPYPSPGASHWVHQRYVELGGKFEDTTVSAKKEELKRAWKNHHEAKKQAQSKHKKNT